MDVVRKRSRARGLLAKTALGVLALLVTGATVATLRGGTATPTVERSSVWTERVTRGDLVRQVPVQGALVPEKVEWLSATSAARVARVAVRPGAVVTPDAIVLVLENPDLELAALEAERQAASAEASLIQLDVRAQVDQKAQESVLVGLRSELRSAEVHASVADRMKTEGLVSALAHGDALNTARGLSERVEAEDARRRVLDAGRSRQLAAQRAELGRLVDIARFRRKQIAALEIRAGIHGVVQDLPLETGQWVTAGTVLARIAEPDRLKARVKVAESSARDVQRGQTVRFETSAGSWGGRVERVDPAVIGGNVEIEVKLDDAMPEGARADQSVTGFVEIERLPGVLRAPRPAGIADQGVHAVFRLDPDGDHASRISAQLGKGSLREVEILGGLAEGDVIVISDTSTWPAADKIRLK